MKVGGNAFFYDSVFYGGFSLAKASMEGNLEFNNVRASTLGMEKDFSALKTDNFILTDTVLESPYYMNSMSYRLIFARSENQLKEIINKSSYSSDTYNNLEAYFRRTGNTDEAEAINIDGKVREGNKYWDERSFGRYVWNWFLYITVGYGKRLWQALLWSLLFLLIGYLVFRKEEYMQVQNEEDKDKCKGRYHPLWYSIALFLPIVQLEDAKTWTPKMNRKKSRFYMRIHIILGYLLIPIGLAAWTGLIK
jgi:hypothetical protein